MPGVVSRIATSRSSISSSSSSICRFAFCRPKTNLLIYCRLNYFTVVFDVAASTFSMCRYFTIFLHNLAAAFEAQNALFLRWLSFEFCYCFRSIHLLLLLYYFFSSSFYRMHHVEFAWHAANHVLDLNEIFHINSITFTFMLILISPDSYLYLSYLWRVYVFTFHY